MSLRDVPPGRRLRYLRLALSALLSGDGGFFIPYRYAGGIAGDRPISAALREICRAALPSCAGLIEAMAALAPELAGIAMEAPSPQPRWGQSWFTGLDAAAYYTLIRQGQPARIVEIGSGHSTRFALRAIADGQLATRLTAIDPSPNAAKRAGGGERIDWHRMTLQALPESARPALAAGDMLFIDSSHILMPGSDIDILLNDWLPTLPTGVLVHVHDIFLPDGYPATWRWRGYNEQPAVSALLAAGGYRLLFGSVLARQHLGAQLAPLESVIVKPAEAFETSIWLEKTG